MSLCILVAAVEFGFQVTNYSISEQLRLSNVGVCVVLNNGTLEREIEIAFNVTDVTAESIYHDKYYAQILPGENFRQFAYVNLYLLQWRIFFHKYFLQYKDSGID